MSKVPRLSVGLPVYNSSAYVADSIEAILGQTFEDFDLIISDNASTDDTGDICRRYLKQDSRVRYFRQPKNVGLSPNHNFCVEQSEAELFKWAAGDDLYARDLLEKCVAALDPAVPFRPLPKPAVREEIRHVPWVTEVELVDKIDDDAFACPLGKQTVYGIQCFSNHPYVVSG